MTCDKQFWIEVAGVLATLILAAVAIWGEPLRAYFVGPRLTVRPRVLGNESSGDQETHGV
jgi:hypothetical protein